MWDEPSRASMPSAGRGRRRAKFSVRLGQPPGDLLRLWRPVLPGPKDDFVPELPVESGCEYIVTFNTKDFVGAEKFGVSAVKPQEFLRESGAIP